MLNNIILLHISNKTLASNIFILFSYPKSYENIFMTKLPLLFSFRFDLKGRGFVPNDAFDICMLLFFYILPVNE